MIDTHAHVYLPEFDDDRNQIIERAAEKGVRQILMPAIDSSTHEKMLEVERNYESCISMIGLHPCSVNDSYQQELEIIADYLTKRKFISIGEIGLDFYWDKTFVEEQYKAFHQQIEIALKYNLPIAIHSRNAIDESINVVRQYPDLRGVFHCFSGTVEQALAIIECKFLIGIGGVVSFKNAGLDKVIEQVGIAHAILETDAPYLAPVPFRGKRNEPSYTALVAQKLADIMQTTIQEVEELTTRNAVELFKL